MAWNKELARGQEAWDRGWNVLPGGCVALGEWPAHSGP